MSGLQWHEPVEGLEFGELFLGAISTTYLAHGWFPGYGLCFTDQRIIGVKIRSADLQVKIPLVAAIVALYLFVIAETFSGQSPLLFLLPLLFHAVSYPVGVLGRRMSERIVSRRSVNPSELIRRKRDFEIRRSEIAELLMKPPEKGSSIFGTGSGYLKIFRVSQPLDPTAIKFLGRTRHLDQYRDLRDKIIDFARREPRVRAMEYPVQ